TILCNHILQEKDHEQRNGSQRKATSVGGLLYHLRRGRGVRGARPHPGGLGARVWVHPEGVGRHYGLGPIGLWPHHHLHLAVRRPGWLRPIDDLCFPHACPVRRAANGYWADLSWHRRSVRQRRGVLEPDHRHDHVLLRQRNVRGRGQPHGGDPV